MKNTILIIALSVFSCVGPADPSHGLVENLPVTMNKSDVITFSLRADDFD